VAQLSEHLLVAELWINWHTTFFGRSICVFYSLFWQRACCRRAAHRWILSWARRESWPIRTVPSTVPKRRLPLANLDCVSGEAAPGSALASAW